MDTSDNTLMMEDHCPKSCTDKIDALENKIDKADNKSKSRTTSRSKVKVEKKKKLTMKKGRKGPAHTQWAKDHGSLIKADPSYTGKNYMKVLHKLWKQQPESVQNKYKDQKVKDTAVKDPKVKSPKSHLSIFVLISLRAGNPTLAVILLI